MNESEKDNTREQYLSPTQTVLKQASFLSSNEPNLSPFRTFRCIKKRMPWSEDEDKTMKQLVNKYGISNWALIARKMGNSRNGKQCRERWYNHLNPSLKKNDWTLDEENILFSKHMQFGNKWAEIASYLPGRTLNDIKNHFYSKLRKFIRKILKQINDEKLFQINGIDSYKYTGEKIYKMIKKHDITLRNLTKDTIFELIIATEKNPKGKFIFFSDNSGNDYNNINNDTNELILKNNNHNFCNNYFLEDSNENFNEKKNNIKNNININQKNGIVNENYNQIDLNLTNNNLCNYSFKLKLRKYSNFSDNKNELNLSNNIKVVQNKNNNSENLKNNNTLIGKKRKKSNNKNSKKSNKEKINTSSKKIKKSTKKIISEDNLSKNTFKEMKYFSGTEGNNNFNFYPPINILPPKDYKNIPFPFSMTKSNKSIKQDDFSFSNKLNLLNDYSGPSFQKVQMFPINCDNLSILQQKNKNNYLMSELSYDNNLLNMNSKNDNTFRNFSINGNYFNKIMKQNNINSVHNLSINNYNMTYKSLDDKIGNKKENDKSTVMNIDMTNNHDFTNAFINGNTSEVNERSQYNNSVYNKNNNNFNLFNSSLPSSVKNFWK